jgi:signal transduction histidine kinase
LAETVADAFYKAYRNSQLYGQSILQGKVIEQERIARELHDTVVQNIFCIGLKLAELREDPALNSTNLAAIDRLRDMVGEIETRLRQIIYDDVQQQNEPLLSQLIGLEIAGHTSVGGILVDSYLDAPDELPPQVLATIRAIVHESLANIRKHSEALHALVTLTIDSDVLYLTIQDDGVGISSDVGNTVDEENRLHFGLSNLQRIVNRIGGDFFVGISDEGIGSAVRVRIPLTFDHFVWKDGDDSYAAVWFGSDKVDNGHSSR